MNGLARRVYQITFASFLIFAIIEALKTLILPSLSIVSSHVLTVIAVGVLTFFTSRYAFARYNTALLKIERQAAGNENTNQLLASVLSSMREGVIIINSKMEVVLCNDAAARLGKTSNGTPTQANGASRALRLTDLIRDPIVSNAFQLAFDTGNSVDATLELASREVHIYQIDVAPIEQHLAVGVFFDITELERLERVRREFFANLSHEVRTPLTTILACAETLLGGAIENREDSARFVEKLHKHALRMDHLISGFSDLSAIESGSVRLNLQPVRLDDAVMQAISFVETRIASSDIKFAVSVPHEMIVRADAVRLGQILTNLLENAVKFNKAEGGVTVTACNKDGSAVIQITDTGIGIAALDLPRIFERLYRGDKSRSQKIEGAGLGLAIVKHLVQAHGGEVKVTSEVGRGSTFTFTLPLSQPPDPKEK